jgi:NAD(P)-dependent dehydrogenase (short-subunit alcohol dehydrogenase family)
MEEYRGDTMKDLFSIKGKTALITGGSRGIGLMMAKGFVEAGAKVYVSSRKADVCQKTAEELSKTGTCIAIPSDLSKEEGVKNLVSELEKQESRLDVLINNAGAGWEAPLETFPEIGWDKVLSINLKAIFMVTRDLLPLLSAAGTAKDPARVINIGSIAAFTAKSLSVYSYGPSKAAVHHLTRVLAGELASQHITVNAIAPGRFPSDMTRNVMANKEQYSREVEEIPLKRWGEPDDIVGLSIFLASPASGYITGVVIPLDGGRLLA